MTNVLKRYPFRVRELGEEEGGGFLCEFPDLPGVLGDGETPIAALKDGRKALESALIALRKAGRGTPQPSSAGAV